MASIEIKGGAKINAALADLAQRMGSANQVKVGFLAGAMYPGKDGKPALPVALAAFWNEFGTTRSKPRPFFRNTIAELAPTLGKRLAGVAKATNYDSERTLALMGEGIKDMIVAAIVAWPADNAESTVAKKGFNKGLVGVDKIMQRAPAYKVSKE